VGRGAECVGKSGVVVEFCECWGGDEFGAGRGWSLPGVSSDAAVSACSASGPRAAVRPRGSRPGGGFLRGRPRAVVRVGCAGERGRLLEAD